MQKHPHSLEQKKSTNKLSVYNQNKNRPLTKKENNLPSFITKETRFGRSNSTKARKFLKSSFLENVSKTDPLLKHSIQDNEITLSTPISIITNKKGRQRNNSEKEKGHNSDSFYIREPHIKKLQSINQNKNNLLEQSNVVRHLNNNNDTENNVAVREESKDTKADSFKSDTTTISPYMKKFRECIRLGSKCRWK